MRIVIDLPDKVYGIIKYFESALDSKYEKGDKIGSILIKAVLDSTPLPKGHGDLIDKGKFKKWIETQDGDKLMTEYYLDALDMQEPIVGGSHDEDID